MSGRRHGEREGESVRLRRDVIVEDRRAGEALSAEAREALDRVAARDHAPGRQTMRRGDAAIATRRDDAIERKPGAHRQLPAQERPVQRYREGQRTNRLRRDPRHRPPLADRLARAPDIQRLQIAQPPVNRAQMVERRAAAEVVPLDERDRQTSLRRVKRDRQPIDAAADDEHVEGAAGEGVEIARHAGHP